MAQELSEAMDEALGGPKKDSLFAFIENELNPETEPEASSEAVEIGFEQPETETETPEPEGGDTIDPENPETETKTETETEEEEPKEELPEGASEKAKESWAKLRESRDKYKTQATEFETKQKEYEEKLKSYESQIEEIRGRAALLPEMEEKLKHLDELEKKVAVLSIEESTEFQKAIREPLDLLAQTAEGLAKANDTSVAELYDALAEADPAERRKKLRDVTAGWDEMDRMDARKIQDEVQELLHRQNEMRANASAAAKEQKERAAAEAQRQAEAAHKEYLKATSDVVEGLKEKLPFVPLYDGETPEDRFAALSEKLKNVDFSKATPNDKAFAAASALAVPALNKTIAKLQAEIKEYEAKEAKRKVVKPAVNESQPKPQEEEKGFFESLGIPKNPQISEKLNVQA